MVEIRSCQRRSPRRAACSVELTMSVNITVASTRSGSWVPREPVTNSSISSSSARRRPRSRCGRRRAARGSARRRCGRRGSGRWRRRPGGRRGGAGSASGRWIAGSTARTSSALIVSKIGRHHPRPNRVALEPAPPAPEALVVGQRWREHVQRARPSPSRRSTPGRTPRPAPAGGPPGSRRPAATGRSAP